MTMRNPFCKIDNLLSRVAIALVFDVLVFALVMALLAIVTFAQLALFIINVLEVGVVVFFLSPALAVAEAMGSKPTLLLSVVGCLIAMVAFVVQVGSRRLVFACLAMLVYVVFAFYSWRMIEKSLDRTSLCRDEVALVEAQCRAVEDLARTRLCDSWYTTPVASVRLSADCSNEV